MSISFKSAISLVKKAGFDDGPHDIESNWPSRELEERGVQHTSFVSRDAGDSPVSFSSEEEAEIFNDVKLNYAGAPVDTQYGWLIELPDDGLMDASGEIWEDEKTFDESDAIDQPRKHYSPIQSPSDYARLKSKILREMAEEEERKILTDEEDEDMESYSSFKSALNLIKSAQLKQDPPPDEDDFSYQKPPVATPKPLPKLPKSPPVPVPPIKSDRLPVMPQQPEPLTSYPGDPLDGSLPGLNVPSDVRAEAFSQAVGLVKKSQKMDEDDEPELEDPYKWDPKRDPHNDPHSLYRRQLGKKIDEMVRKVQNDLLYMVESPGIPYGDRKRLHIIFNSLRAVVIEVHKFYMDEFGNLK